MANITIRVSAANQTLNACVEVYNDSVEALNAEVEDEVEEYFQVALAHAIVHPSAMMIHPEHTATAFAAVMCARRLDALALEAVAHELLLQVLHLVLCDREARRFARAREYVLLIRWYRQTNALHSSRLLYECHAWFLVGDGRLEGVVAREGTLGGGLVLRCSNALDL